MAAGIRIINSTIIVGAGFMVLTGCHGAIARSTAAPVGQSVASADVCGLHRPMPAGWDLSNLPPDLAQFYGRVADKRGVSLETLLGPIADSYHSREYSRAEFISSLISLRTLIEKPIQAFELTDFGISEPRLWGDMLSQPLVLFLDPVCSSCKRVFEIVSACHTNCKASLPPVIPVLMPSQDEVSLYAASVLELVREKERDLFLPIFVEMIHASPASMLGVEEFASNNLGRDFLDPVGLSLARGRVVSLRGDDRFNGAAAPLVVYRGRVIRRISEGDTPFDPFRSWSSFMFTLQLIESVDSL